MNEDLSKQLFDAVKRKAIGYMTTENVEEYSLVDGELCIVKRKVTQKEVPPDIAAVKFLIDEDADEYSEMSEEELKKEKIRLLNLLKEAEDATDKSKAQHKVRDGSLSQ